MRDFLFNSRNKLNKDMSNAKNIDLGYGSIKAVSSKSGFYDVYYHGGIFKNVPIASTTLGKFSAGELPVGFMVTLGFNQSGKPFIIDASHKYISVPVEPVPPVPEKKLAQITRPYYNFGKSSFVDVEDIKEDILTGEGEVIWSYSVGEVLGYSSWDEENNYLYTNKGVYTFDLTSVTTVKSFDILGQTGYSSIFTNDFWPVNDQFFDADSQKIRQTDYTFDYESETISANTALDGSLPDKTGFNKSGAFLFGSSYFNSSLTANTREMLQASYSQSAVYKHTDVYKQTWGSRTAVSTPAFTTIAGEGNLVFGGATGDAVVMDEDGKVTVFANFINYDSFVDHPPFGPVWAKNIYHMNELGVFTLLETGVELPFGGSFPNYRTLRFLGNRPRFLRTNYPLTDTKLIIDSITETPEAIDSATTGLLNTHLTQGTIANNTKEVKVTSFSANVLRIYVYDYLIVLQKTFDVDISELVNGLAFGSGLLVIDSEDRVFFSYWSSTEKRRGVMGIDLTDEEVCFHYKHDVQSDSSDNLFIRYFGGLVAMVEQDSTKDPVEYKGIMVGKK